MKTGRALSFSQIKLWLNCHAWYKFKYRDGIAEIETSPLRKGKAIHKAIELYQKYCIKNGYSTSFSALDKILDMLKSELREESSDRSNISSELNHFEFEEVAELLDRFIQTHSIEESVRFNYQIEERLAFKDDWTPCAWDDPDCFFRGILDLNYVTPDGKMVIVDYKSNMHIPYENTFFADPMIKLQCDIYAYLKSLGYSKIARFETHADFLRYGGTIHIRKIGKGELDYVPKFIENIYNEITTETVWDEMVGEHCNYCPHQIRCKKHQKVLETTGNIPPENDDDAKTIAQHIIVCEASVKKNKAILKDYTNKNETMVRIGNEAFGFHKKKTTTVTDISEVKKVLMTKGVFEHDILKHCTLSKTELYKCIKNKNKGWIDTLIPKWKESGVIKESESTSFGLGKVEQECVTWKEK